MLKSCKLYIALSVFILNVFLSFGQEVEYKDVLLDGKPAKLNVATGEITLVKPKEVLKVKDSSAQKQDFQKDFHIVNEGETLLDISEKYGVPINVLKKANGLETTLIDAGEKVRIRNFDDYNPPTSKPISRGVHNFNSDFHTVKNGETLYGIAKRYEIDLITLKQENNLNSNTINEGQKLQIRNFDLSKDINSTQVWVVKVGDTLWSIASKTGTTVSKLKRINGLQGDVIKVGQKLVLK
ncbi:LysM peptidoglycan-binding domain-containing protein [Winogradskyella vincentii]|uniref:LysM peptidoglycan-binding domain-containing protein n=1 Tax=Winogradskyella vincentii TaxID=2877122 RepID=A0ABS7Y5B8_9FLAO|nr:LysM peptidoglycan-binding domain-containing protein [Winogradskyella vincentii]MCA0153827.1 LysM peptidoglycan-binding domain-containing protein [Winogradskyella vincentii]